MRGLKGFRDFRIDIRIIEKVNERGVSVKAKRREGVSIKTRRRGVTSVKARI